jgi:glucose/arabinose dehydrogenase
MRPGLLLLAALALLAAGGWNPDSGPSARRSASAFGLTLVAKGFSDPIHVTAPRSEPDTLYVVQRNGRVYALDRSSSRLRVFLDLRRRVGREGFQGLLSVAFHPRYASNRRVFAFYTTAGNDIFVEEYRSREASVDLRTRRLVLRVRQPKRGRYGHFGGQLAFGPDGRLYAAIGDGLDDGAQSPTNLYGKLLRLDVDGRLAKPVVLAFGLRNPWRFSFDRRTGALYVADVGESRWEEVNLLRANATGLANFGWDVFEGRDRRRDGDGTLTGRLVFPVAEYRHAAGNCSITGGFVYRGTGVPAARGRYFFGDFCSGRIWTLRAGAGRGTMRQTGLRVRLLTSFGEDARGELYLVSRRGHLYRLSER